MPGGIPKPIVNWLIDYVDSGGDLYVLIRGGYGKQHRLGLPLTARVHL